MSGFFGRYNFRELLKRYYRYAINHIKAKKYLHLDKNVIISPQARIIGSKNISLGVNTIVHAFATLQSSIWNTESPPAGKIIIGDNCAIQSYSLIWTCGGDIRIGNFCSVNPFCAIYGHGGLIIGNYVRIAANVSIIPGNHKFDNPDVPILYQGGTMEGVIIEDDVWIGAGVIILDGVKIGKGCVIAAGAVVNKSTEPYGVYAGVPAVRIKDRNEKN